MFYVTDGCLQPVESSSLREIEKKVLLEENNVRARVKKY